MRRVLVVSTVCVGIEVGLLIIARSWFQFAMLAVTVCSWCYVRSRAST